MPPELTLSLVSLLLSAAVAYFTTTYSLRREMRHGVLRLVELCRRYLVNFVNAFDHETHHVKGGELPHEMYVTELRVIVAQLDSLLDNAYVGRLAIEYPLVSVLLAQIRRELVELSRNREIRSLNPGTVGAVAGLYRTVKRDLPQRYFRNELDGALEESLGVLEKAGIITVRST